ncbi:hypothetical protein AB0932_35255 [Streptomyces sp. NPDC006682]|uniref:hypothetical protein n=1 Tax=unclassified Streptomyces TaxID=2593676 RepID=UPI0029BFA07B|nr:MULTISPECIES: hypothetical protein [unclassified Streptomyces]MDX2623617.1 hypothetical protein [Streptomyces sp. WI03-5b]MEE1774973.1 hypothetical protein [Streptomyces sp. JV181]
MSVVESRREPGSLLIGIGTPKRVEPTAEDLMQVVGAEGPHSVAGHAFAKDVEILAGQGPSGYGEPVQVSLSIAAYRGDGAENSTPGCEVDDLV